MISNGLRNWQQLKSFRIDGDTVYGVYKKIGFSVCEEDGGKLFIFMLSGMDSAFDAIEDSFTALRGALREIQVGDVENYLALFYDETGGAMMSSDMDALLEFVSINALSMGFRMPTICVKCGAPAQKRAFYKNMVQPLCVACRDAEKNAAASRSPQPYAPASPYSAQPYSPPPTRSTPANEYAQDWNQPAVPAQNPYGVIPDQSITRQRVPMTEEQLNAQDKPHGDGNMLKGILGALLGTIAGLIPYFISVFIGFELGALCFITGIGATFGYTAFDGLRKKSTALGVIFLFAELLSIAAILIVKVVGGDGGELSFETMDYINILMAALGAALGVAVCLDRVNKHVA